MGREGHKAVVPFLARRVPVEVQDEMPLMSIRSRRGEFSQGRRALSSLLPAAKGLEEADRRAGDVARKGKIGSLASVPLGPPG